MVEPDIQRTATLFLERLKGRYELTGAFIYGSRARGDHHPDSDLDLAVILRAARAAPGERVQVKLELADIAFDILLETGMLISALPVWQDEWKEPQRGANPRLLENIQREGAPV